MPGEARRWIQWRMRTLLILMTLVAGGLAFWNYFIAVYISQETAIEQLQTFEAQLTSDPAAPALLSPIVGEDRYHNVVECRMAGYNMVGADLAPLADLPFLKRLYLSTSGVDDHGSFYISKLSRLERLSLWRTRITDAALPNIAKCRQLRVLDLHQTCVTDAGLAALTPLENLRYLKLGGPIYGPGLRDVAKLPQLRALELTESRVGYDDLKYLAGSRVEEVWLDPHFPATAAKHLCNLPNLRRFHSKIVHASDATVKQLTSCRRLEQLEIYGLGVTDRSAMLLRSMPQLRRLRLYGDLTDATLQSIGDLELDEAHLTGRFSRKAIQKLADRRPTLTGSITTLIPAEDYDQANTKKIGSLEIRPLISVAGARYGAKGIRSLPRSRMLHAWVAWPATLKDAAELTNLKDRVLALYMAGPPTLRPHSIQPKMSLEGLEQFVNLRELHLYKTERNQLARIEDARQLREIVFQDSGLTDEDLAEIRLPKTLGRLIIVPSHASLAGMKKLRSRYPKVEMRENGHGKIYANHRWQSARVGQPTFATIVRNKKIRSVQLHGFREPLDLDPLAQLKHLEELEVIGERSREPMWRLTKPLPKLVELNLSRQAVVDRDLEQLRHCPSLERLYLTGTSISDNAFEHLALTPKLKVLTIRNRHPIPNRPSGPWITGKKIPTLVRNCPDLVELDLRGSWVRDEDLAALPQLRKLERLRLNGTIIGDNACRHLAKIPNVIFLDLAATRIGDKGLEQLSRSLSPKLRTVSLYGAKVTQEGMKRVRKKMKRSINFQL